MEAARNQPSALSAGSSHPGPQAWGPPGAGEETCAVHLQPSTIRKGQSPGCQVLQGADSLSGLSGHGGLQPLTESESSVATSGRVVEGPRLHNPAPSWLSYNC